MPKGKKAKLPSPEKANVNVAATYLLAKHTGLFQPGQPFIVAFGVPSKNYPKPKEKRDGYLQK